jgi:hypothetical protein
MPALVWLRILRPWDALATLCATSHISRLRPWRLVLWAAFACSLLWDSVAHCPPFLRPSPTISFGVQEPLDTRRDVRARWTLPPLSTPSSGTVSHITMTLRWYSALLFPGVAHHGHAAVRRQMLRRFWFDTFGVNRCWYVHVPWLRARVWNAHGPANTGEQPAGDRSRFVRFESNRIRKQTCHCEHRPLWSSPRAILRTNRNHRSTTFAPYPYYEGLLHRKQTSCA